VAAGATIVGVEKFEQGLLDRGKAVGTPASVAVGFATAYALWVHENLLAAHPVGQAKFLEQPWREYAERIRQIIREQLAKGSTMGQALLVAGLFLQREAQLLCPVDTGALRNSAFTVLEQG